MVVSSFKTEPWRARLTTPNYAIKEAARYAGVSSKTVSIWHKSSLDERKATLSEKEKGVSLSYLQLIEVAVVSAFRKSGITLSKIREARNYISLELQSEHPFAEYKFKTDGRDIWINYEEIEASSQPGKLLGVTKKGQLAWSLIIGRLQEFEYERDGIVVSWSVAGIDSPVRIDPRISFGAPSVGGIPTWAIRGRWVSGETVGEISEDFQISNHFVEGALAFEGVSLS